MQTVVKPRPAPRRIEVIDRDYATLESEYNELQAMLARVECAAEKLEERIPKLQRAYAYGELYNGRLIRSQGEIDNDIALLALLRGDIAPPANIDDTTLSRVNSLAPADPAAEQRAIVGAHGLTLNVGTLPQWWIRAFKARERCEEIVERQAELLAERRAREKGPGERAPYRLLSGGAFARTEDGRLRMYRPSPHTVVMLDSWEAANVIARGSVIDRVNA